MSNITLTNAKKAKNDEFYTQYQDIQKEVEAYLEYNPNTFRNKVVYCNCDDPYESNFFRYFVLNFRKLGLKKLITTSYSPSPIAGSQLDLFDTNNKGPISQKSQKKMAIKFVIQEVGDIDEDGEFNLKDIAKQLKDNKNNEWSPLQGNGDFRSKECIELLKQSDIVVTNPPFSLFREYVKQLFDYNKKFLIIGSISAITYKEIFPLIRDNKMWLGNGFSGGITNSIYDKFYIEFRSRIDEIDEKLNNFQKAEDNYFITVNYLLELANRSYELFLSSKLEEKRLLIKLTLSNLEAEGKTLRYNLLKPFNYLFEYSSCPTGLPRQVSNLEPTG